MTGLPIRLKQYAEKLGGQGELAQLITKAGYRCSRSLVNQTCNHGQLPKRSPEAYRKAVNQVLKAKGLSVTSAWLPLKKGGTGSVALGGARTAGSQPSNHEGTQRGKPTMNRTKEYLEPEHLRHFRLPADPFADIADHRGIWLNERLQRVKGLVQITAQTYGLMVITGEYGAGKSTLLRHVLGEMLLDGKTQIIMPDRLDRKAMRGDMLTAAVIHQLGASMRMPRSAGERDQLAKRLLAKAVQRGERPFLVIDEAHDLKTDLFIALKRLWDSGLIFRNIGILLVGAGGKDKEGRPWGLRWDIEGNPDLREFAERTRLVDLGRLTEDLPEYLAWRFHVVGADLCATFTPDSIPLLVERAPTPQLLGNLAVAAMREAYLDGALAVTAEHVLGV